MTGIPATDGPSTLEDQASEAFVRRLQGEWTGADQADLEARLASDPQYADAYRRVMESWGLLDAHAEQPEMIVRREKALVSIRRSSVRRWSLGQSATGRGRLAAALVVGVVLGLGALQLSPYGYHPGVYRTGTGEQRMLDLEDHTRVALDAKTNLRVRYTRDVRLVQLREGQAQFYVAKDPARPFKVQVGGRTIVALGTVFTVEYADRQVRIAMVEGRVAVYPPDTGGGTGSGSSLEITQRQSASGPAPERPRRAIELAAGEALQIAENGRQKVAPADLQLATAWRSGKVIFREERLDSAARRLNRYSRLQIAIDSEALAAKEISGVFEIGDTENFVRAVQRSYPVTTEYLGSDLVRLRTH